MSGAISRSSCRNGTRSRSSACSDSIAADDFSGRWNSSACAALSHSIATMPAVRRSHDHGHGHKHDDHKHGKGDKGDKGHGKHKHKD